MPSILIRFSLMCLLIAGSASATHAQTEPFQLGGQTIAPGSRQDITLSISAGQNDGATHIPVTVIHSATDGPVLLVVAGVHGFEFASILANKQLAAELQPEGIKGTLVLVRAAHVSAFEERSPYVNPYDRKNLNRSFPGSSNGSQTERIAYHLSHDLIAHADFVLDVHSGDGAEWLTPFIGVYGGPLATNYDLAMKAAKASGFKNLVTYKMNTQEQVDTRRSLNRQAVAAQKPTLLLEAGQNGSRDQKMIDMQAHAIKNIMVTLGMLDTSFQTSAADNINDLEGTFSIPAPESGIWTPTVKAGQRIEKGQVLGTLYDYFGSEVTAIKAPQAGYALYGLAGPPVKKGQGLITVAKYKNATGS